MARTASTTMIKAPSATDYRDLRDTVHWAINHFTGRGWTGEELTSAGTHIHMDDETAALTVERLHGCWQEAEEFGTRDRAALLGAICGPGGLLHLLSVARRDSAVAQTLGGKIRSISQMRGIIPVRRESGANMADRVDHIAARA